MKRETVLSFEKKPLWDYLCPIAEGDIIIQRKLISQYYDNNIVPLGKDVLENMFYDYNNIYFLPREVAETDRRYLHLIPYIIIRHKEKFLSYWRNKQAGESRLHDKMSIGFGGHINTTSARHDGEALNLYQTITANISQELFEELGINVNPIFGRDCFSGINTIKKTIRRNIIKLSKHNQLTLLGIIMSSDSEVNSVHLGLIFLLNWDEIDLTGKNINEDGIELFKYHTIDELQQNSGSLESWSQTALKFMQDSEFSYEP